MVSHLRAIVIAFFFSAALPVAAQQVQAPASSAPSADGAEIPGSNQGKAAQEKQAPATNVPVLKPAQPPKDQAARRDRERTDDGVGTKERGHSDNELTIANFTIALAFATFLLAVATFALAWYTRGVQTETKRLADTAVESLNSDRAWITFENPTTFLGSQSIDEAGRVHDEAQGFAVNWSNTGRYPAQKIGLFADHMVIGINEDIPIFDIPDVSEEGRGAVGPGRAMQSPIRWIYGDDLTRFKARQVKLILYSRSLYVSGKDESKTSTSEACLSFVFNGTRRGAGGQVEINYEITVAGTQNRLT